MINEKIIGDIFSGISKIYDRFLSAATFGKIHSWQKELIDRMNPKGNWLDVGTGTGEVLKKLKGRNYQGLLIGIDIAYDMLSVAKLKCPDCHFILAKGESLPFRDKSLSNISLSLVFRHLIDKESFLKEAARTLDKEGCIGIIDIRRFKGTGFILFLMKKLFFPAGVLIFGRDKWDFFIHSVENSYSVEEIREMLEANGFRLRSVKTRFLGAVAIMVAVKTA